VTECYLASECFSGYEFYEITVIRTVTEGNTRLYGVASRKTLNFPKILVGALIHLLNINEYNYSFTSGKYLNLDGDRKLEETGGNYGM
jgi:hypothetical protein